MKLSLMFEILFHQNIEHLVTLWLPPGRPNEEEDFEHDERNASIPAKLLSTTNTIHFLNHLSFNSVTVRHTMIYLFNLLRNINKNKIK